MQPFRLFQFLVAAFVGLAFSSAHGSTIQYSASSLGGTQWRYDYLVGNTSSDTSIDEFTIFFAPDRYANLQAASIPAGWDVLAIDPNASLGFTGFYDGLALNSGIAPSSTLGGFGVTFDYLAAGVPGAQAFSIVNATTFETLETGTTALASVAIPVPATLLLLLAGGVPLLHLRRPRVAVANDTNAAVLA